MPPIMITNAQFYFALGVPLVGILVNVVMISMLSHRVDRLEDRVERLEGRVDGRFTGLEDRVQHGFDLLTGKIGELDNRLTRLEERLAR